MAYEYMAGSTLIGMEDLKALGLRGSPQPGYRPFSTVVKLGDNTQKGQGFPIVTWHWAFLSVAERDVFISMTSAGSLSAPAFIRSRLPDNTWATFECIMNLPTGEENLSVGQIIGFDLVFTECVLIPDYP